MVGHEGSSAGSYLADPTSPIPSHCASIVATSTVRVKCHNHFSSSTYSSYIPCNPSCFVVISGWQDVQLVDKKWLAMLQVFALDPHGYPLSIIFTMIAVRDK